jgi:hypothetical protein
MMKFDIQYLFEDPHAIFNLINEVLVKKKLTYDMIKDIQDGEYVRFFLGKIINRMFYRNISTQLVSFNNLILKKDKDNTNSYFINFLTKVCSINLSNHKMSGEMMKIFSAFLQTNEVLKHIDLSFCEINDENLKVLFEGIANNMYYKDLSIELFYNEITDKGCGFIHDLLMSSKKSNYKLHISLWSNQVSDEGLQKLIALTYKLNYLEKWRNIKLTFQLQKNDINEKSGEVIFNSIQTLKCLSFFDLTCNKLSSAGLTPLSLIPKTEFINIQTLNLSNNNIGDDGLFHISNSIGKLFFAENIILRENSITYEGVKYFMANLIKVFKKEINIEMVKSHKNNVDKEIKYIYPKVLQIENLDFSYNNLGKGVLYISNFLYQNFRIKSLLISECNISLIDVVFLAKALKRNKYLKKLDISKNNFFSEVLSEFCREFSTHSNQDSNLMLRRHNSFDNSEHSISTLEELNLNYNKLNDESMEDLNLLLSRNLHIKKLGITYSLITDKGLQDLFSKHGKIQLRSLNLSDCKKFTINGLGNILCTFNNEIEELYISNYNFYHFQPTNSKGFIQYLKSICSVNLRLLDLSSNSINDELFKTIMKAISSNPVSKIQFLNFALNDISDLSIEFLISILPQLKDLKEIRFNANKITQIGITLLQEYYSSKLDQIQYMPLIDLRNKNESRKLLNKDIINLLT